MDNKNICCCFTGHRELPEDKTEISQKLKKIVLQLINSGVSIFYAGGAKGFDMLAEKIILDLKNEFPHIKLILALPCKNQTVGWDKADIDQYNEILNLCDKYVYISEKYYKGCMFKRNRYLVNNSFYCICYLKKDSGGTFYTVKYAEKNGLEIFNVG